MAGLDLTAMIEPGLGLSFPEWLDRVEDIALDHGFFDPLGPDHSGIFIEQGSRLLVTFELADRIRSQSNQDVPLGWSLAQPHEWSQLCILGHEDSWFRHRAIYEFFDRLTDEGFFDRFDNIVFYGAGSCAYAAAAYSVAAPGATVMMISPQATLDPRIAEWDHRFPQARRIDFGGRYGFAPRMLDAAARAFLFYDPQETEDAMHSALFEAEHVTRVRCRHFDGQIEAFFRRMGVLDGLVLLAMRGRLTPHLIHLALRERRSYLPYLRRMLVSIERQDRPYLAGLFCRAVLQRINAPRFHRQLALAQRKLAAEGRRLPAPRKARSA